MANQEHLDILIQGIERWNRWRKKHHDILPDLREVNLIENYLTGIDFSCTDLTGAHLASTHFMEADLRKATLTRANLTEANLMGANLSDADLRFADLSGANLSDANLTEANLIGATLIKAFLARANLSGAALIKANLAEANLYEANLSSADLSGANLSGAAFSGIVNFTGAYLIAANLSGARLYEADLSSADLSGGVNLSGAVLTGAHLTGVNLSHANLIAAILTEANLSHANLTEANLSGAQLIRTNLTKAILTQCSIYGISAWDVKLEGAIQNNLVVTPYYEPAIITVDNLEVAQFIYLLLNNKKIREVIDTITSKVVLILGRFTPERKAILDALRDALRAQNYSPIVFDFEIPGSRDITETVSLLARMARFVIADLTDAKSIPQELSVIVPDLPSVPVQPLLQTTDKAYSMFEHWMRYSWVLKIYYYTSVDDLLPALKEHIIDPAEQKVQELRRPQ